MIKNRPIYEKAIKLRKKTGYGSRKVYQILVKQGISINYNTVVGWFYNNYEPRKSILNNHMKKNSSYLGYIIGVCLGDGSITCRKTAHAIKLDTIDEDFSSYFADILEKWSGKKPSIKLREGGVERLPGDRYYMCKPKYRVVVSAVELAEFLKKKIKNLEWIYNTDKEFKKMIVKGLFDSEGSINRSSRNMSFTNTDLNIIHLFKNLCKDWDIDTSSIKAYKGKYQHKQVYTLYIYKHEYRKIFLNKIGITIKRKRDLLKKIVDSYSKNNFSKEELEKKYFKEKKSMIQMAKEANITPPAIAYWMKKHNLKIRTISEARQIMFNNPQTISGGGALYG